MKTACTLWLTIWSSEINGYHEVQSESMAQKVHESESFGHLNYIRYFLSKRLLKRIITKTKFWASRIFDDFHTSRAFISSDRPNQDFFPIVEQYCNYLFRWNKWHRCVAIIFLRNCIYIKSFFYQRSLNSWKKVFKVPLIPLCIKRVLYSNFDFLQSNIFY